MPITIQEITMAAPDIVRVEIWEPDIDRGFIETLSAPDTGTGTFAVTACGDNGAGLIRISCSSANFGEFTDRPVWVFHSITGCTEANGAWPLIRINSTTLDLEGSTFTNAWTGGGRLVAMTNFLRSGTAPATPADYPLAGLSSYFIHVGPSGLHKRWVDIQITDYLDRASIVDFANYGAIGTRSVTAATLKTEPRQVGFCNSAAGGSLATVMGMKHFVYLKLSGNIEVGSHTIDFPAGTGLANQAFTFAPNTTRCSSIHVNQLGWRSGDIEKTAYLSCLAPGLATHGQIEFAATYSQSTFQIINTSGKIVYTGNVVLTTAPTDAETGVSAPRYRVVSSTVPKLTITGITKANPGVITYTGTDPSNGDYIYINDVLGMVQINGVYGKIANVNTGAKTFELNTEAGAAHNTTTYSTYTGDGTVGFTYAFNRAATYVYKMDFSDFTPTHDAYYLIKLANMGVSDPILISETAWYEAASIYGQGMYHQRNGLALDGRFGYTAPAPTVPYYRSYCPACFESQGSSLGISGGDLIHNSILDNPTWLAPGTSTVMGGWRDAGDEDDFLTNYHSLSAHEKLETYEMLPSGARNISWGLPKATAVLDATLYAGTDGMGDLWQEAAWFIDFWRRLQNGDGSVPSALQFTGHGQLEPVFHNHFRQVLTLPDHLGGFAYVHTAAKFARICRDAGFTTLADTFETSAQDAWDWAENIYTDATARDAYYLDFYTRSEWSAGAYATNMALLQSQCAVERTAAVAAMFRLTGNTAFEDIILDPSTGYSTWNYSLAMGAAAFDYINTPGADATAVTAMKAGMQSLLTSRYPMILAGTGQSYKSATHTGYAWEYGGSGNITQNSLQTMMRCHQFTNDDAYLGYIAAAMSYHQGCNQKSLCYTTGAGYRPVTQPLHIDWVAQGVDAPSGLSVYGPGEAYITAFLSWGQSALNQITEAAQGFTTDYVDKHMISPTRGHWPPHEMYWESTFQVELTEYTMHQTISPNLRAALYLHAYDGNSAITRWGGKTRFRVTTS